MSVLAEAVGHPGREQAPPVLRRPDAEGSTPVRPSDAVTVIEPRTGWSPIDLDELWRYRELLYFLTWRDVKVRYKQTVLGALWAILQPLATMVVFSLFFGRALGGDLGSGDMPYPLFVLAGLIPWTFFASAITSTGQSVVGSQNLITKVYFPRLIIPLGSLGVGLVDLAISCGLLGAVMLAYGVLPGLGALLAPPILLVLAIAAAGTGTLLSALTVAYRDFRYVVPFLVQFWMFATPSIYMRPGAAVGRLGRLLLPLNPAYGLIANFRSATLGEALDLYSLAVSTAVALLGFLIGCLYFRRVERGFADVI